VGFDSLRCKAAARQPSDELTYNGPEKEAIPLQVVAFPFYFGVFLSNGASVRASVKRRRLRGWSAGSQLSLDVGVCAIVSVHGARAGAWFDSMLNADVLYRQPVFSG
jgi:hypothetical protein